MAGKGSARTQFKAGQSGNPNGRAPLPEDVREASKLTTVEFCRLVHQYFFMTREEIQQSLTNPDATMMQLLIGGMVAKTAKDYDHRRAAFLLDKMIVPASSDASLHEDIWDSPGAWQLKKPGV